MTKNGHFGATFGPKRAKKGQKEVVFGMSLLFGGVTLSNIHDMNCSRHSDSSKSGLRSHSCGNSLWYDSGVNLLSSRLVYKKKQFDKHCNHSRRFPKYTVSMKVRRNFLDLLKRRNSFALVTWKIICQSAVYRRFRTVAKTDLDYIAEIDFIFIWGAKVA